MLSRDISTHNVGNLAHIDKSVLHKKGPGSQNTANTAQTDSLTSKNALKDRNYILQSVNSTLVQGNNAANKRIQQLEKMLRIREEKCKRYMLQTRQMSKDIKDISNENIVLNGLYQSLLKNQEKIKLDNKKLKEKLSSTSENSEVLYQLLEKEVKSKEASFRYSSAFQCFFAGSKVMVSNALSFFTKKILTKFKRYNTSSIPTLSSEAKL